MLPVNVGRIKISMNSSDSTSQRKQLFSSGFGLVFLDEGDELIDSFVSRKYLEEYYKVITYTGGTHRFEHIPESISIIEEFVLQPRE